MLTAPVRMVRQSGRYLLVAGLTALGYLAVLALALPLVPHYLIAILIAQVVTIACAFPLYRHFVFGPGPRLWADLLRFVSVWGAGALSGIVVTPLLVELLAWHPLFAQVVAIGAFSVASFLAHRYFTFRPRRVRLEDTESARDGSP